MVLMLPHICSWPEKTPHIGLHDPGSLLAVQLLIHVLHIPHGREVEIEPVIKQILTKHARHQHKSFLLLSFVPYGPETLCLYRAADSWARALRPPAFPLCSMLIRDVSYLLYDSLIADDRGNLIESATELNRLLGNAVFYSDIKTDVDGNVWFAVDDALYLSKARLLIPTRFLFIILFCFYFFFIFKILLIKKAFYNFIIL